eukprot:m.91474 g.91474  ORF g.91474 m.91474 type:complete len:386 (-) comp26472_c0_seq1:104-1261(-)
MKLLSKQFEKDGAGSLKLIPTETEDMWHLYNLISELDTVTATAVRKVKTESSTGSTDSKKVRTTLTITVIKVEFDSECCSMRVSGRTIEGNEFVNAGAHHTLELELNRAVTITKPSWDLITLERIDLACNAAKSADVGAVVMQDGLAHVCAITSSMTLVQCKIEMNVPRKGKDRIGTQHEKGMQKFFDKVFDAIANNFDFDVVKCVLICSPGHLKENFLEYLLKEAIKRDNKTLIKNKSKFLTVNVSSGHKHALNEALQDPAVVSRLSNTKAAGEVKALDDFYKMLNTDADRAFYGYNHVAHANEQQAIETLLVTDALFRSNDIATRRRYVELVQTATDNGATLHIFSSLHVSGERLGLLSGVAAILRFPVLVEDDDASSSDDDT